MKSFFCTLFSTLLRSVDSKYVGPSRIDWQISQLSVSVFFSYINKLYDKYLQEYDQLKDVFIQCFFISCF